MTGEILTPKELVLPKRESEGVPAVSGSIYISGSKICFSTGTAEETVTSS